MFKKTVFFFIFFSFFLNNHLLTENKVKIIEKLKLTKSLKFEFKQKTNEINEQGTCYLIFPEKLKCIYDDKSGKEIIVNKNILAVIKKKYNKTYFYPINKSPFFKILSKKKLIELINNSSFTEAGNNFELIYQSQQAEKISIFFNKKDMVLNGWKTQDKYQNKIIFLINIITINENFDPRIFKIPPIN